MTYAIWQISRGNRASRQRAERTRDDARVKGVTYPDRGGRFSPWIGHLDVGTLPPC
jgi:hypothetical protein